MVPRPHLVARLARAERLQTSFRAGRIGWLLTSPLSLAQLRGRLQRWCRRANVVHEPSGRYFAQPHDRYYLRSLELKPSRESRLFFDCPQRSERLRRVRNFLPGAPSTSKDPRGRLLFERMALRMDTLAHHCPTESLWKHMGTDFDELWYRVPLFAMSLGPLPHRVLNLLCEVQDVEVGESLL